MSAGDSFIAAFCVALLNGKSLEDSVDAGINLSSYVVSKDKAVPVSKE